MKKIFPLFFIFILLACGGEKKAEKKETILVEGSWLLEFSISNNEVVPVDLTINKSDSSFIFTFNNDEENFAVTDITIDNNKIIFKDPVFDTWFEGKIMSPRKIKGKWYKGDKDYKLPFVATQGETSRFKKLNSVTTDLVDLSGKWEVDFSYDNVDEHIKSIGLFNQDNNYLSGTFLTETGDYRFLEGNVYDNKLNLSCFDGSHVFLFKAELKKDTLYGKFWSGSHWKENWKAYRNNNFELRNPDSLTFLKEGYNKLSFSFPDLDSNIVSLSDKKYKNKVVIVNIMGPWCPNCKDETMHLTELYNKYNSRGLEIIALSFDKTDDFNKTKHTLTKLKNHFNSKYDYLIVGKANKIEAAKALPMLNHIMSYPTSIFIDKKGNIRKIRTGFYGPSTGNYYTRYVEQTNDLIEKLLTEE